MDPYRSAARMQCPRCDVRLVTDAPAETCTGCGGIFLGEAHLARALGAGAPARMSLWWRTPELRCPVCDVHMRVLLASKIIIIDRCRDHGIWLDAGELAHLMSASGVGPRTASDVLDQLRRLLEVPRT